MIDKLKDEEIQRLRKALQLIAGEIGRFAFAWPETHEDYPSFAVMTAREALKIKQEGKSDCCN